MARENLNMIPRSADEKPRVLHKLQGSIHFEKTLSATTVASYGKNTAALTIPSWFVRKHGDKFGKSAFLRTESSTERWPVNLYIWIISPTTTQVRFGGCWQAFSDSHGLLDGDMLIFVLMAMSEFKVYVFRNTQGPNKFPPRKQRRCSYNAAHSRKIAKLQPYRKCRDVLSSADEEKSDEGMNGSETTGSTAVYDCAIAPTRSSCKGGSLHHLPSFWKILTATNAGRNGQPQLELPGGFCRKYGNRIRTVVKLQGIHEQSPERTMACRTSFGRDIRHYLGAEWQDFVSENHLHEGQQLLFTLSADSVFVVREQSAL